MISNKIITYQNIIAYLMFFCWCNIWFFDFGRSWFFDSSSRAKKTKVIVSSKTNFPLTRSCGSTPKDTTANILFEAESTVETSSNTVSERELCDSLDVAGVLVGVAVNLVVSVVEGEVNSDCSTGEQLNPILAAKMLTTESTKLGNVSVERIDLTSKVSIRHGEAGVSGLSHSTVLVCLVSRNLSIDIEENRILECNDIDNLHSCKQAPNCPGCLWD